MHGQDAGQGHLLLLATGEVEGLPSPQVVDVQVVEGFVNPSGDLRPRQPQVLRPEGHLIDHPAAQDLALRVLQHRAHDLGDGRQGLIAGLFPVETDPPLQIPPVTAGDEAIQAADQGGFAAAAGPGHQHDLPCLQFKGDVAQGIIRPVAIFERELLHS